LSKSKPALWIHCPQPGEGQDKAGGRTGGEVHDPAAITDHQAIDRIIDHLKLTFVAEKPLPSQVFEQVALMAAEESGEYF